MKIDKDQIKSFIKQIPSKIWQGIKNVYTLPHSGKYMLLSLFLLIIFLVITFPYNFLILKKIYALEGNSIKSIELPVFSFSIIGDTVIEKPIIILNNSNEITCERATISTPNPVSFLLSKKIKSNFSINLLKLNLKDSEVICDFHGNVELSLDKKTYMPTDGKLQIGGINIVLKSVAITIPNIGLQIKQDSRIINCQGIDSTLTNGVLRFDKFELKGDIAAEISGSVALTNKKLDLIISIDTDNKELEPFKDLLTKYIKNDRITLKVGATTEKPEIIPVEKDKNEN